MKITLIYNDFKKDINIDLFKKNGLIQETILNCCSLIIYNIEKTDIIFDNDDFYTIGGNNILFDDTFSNFLIKRLDYYKKLNINCEINEHSKDSNKFVSRFIKSNNKTNYKIYSICDNVYFDESIKNNYDKNEIIDLPNHLESTKEHINPIQEIPGETLVNIDTFAIPQVVGQCERIKSSNESLLKEDSNIFSEIDISLIDPFLKIRNIIIYDRKRDGLGNVIKDNYIIDRYTKWYQNYENENYINYIRNYNSNIIRFPFNSLLQNILTNPLNINDNEENENNEIKDDIESDIIDQNINNEIDLQLSNNENILDPIGNSQELNPVESEVDEEQIISDITNNNLHNRDINNFINIFDNFIRNSNNNEILDNPYFNILNENVNIINILNQMNYEDNGENNDLPDLIPINEINNIYIPSNIYYTTAVDNNQYINEDVIIAIDDEEFNKNKSDKYDSFNLGENKCCECLICMEQFNNEDIVTEIKCRHIFHKNCIKEWLCKQSNKCPICRIEVGEGKPINI
jgi:hypothetical protein